MKKITFIFLFGVLMLWFASCSKKGLYSNSICWEITDGGSSMPSYILGSIHMLDTNRIHIPADKIKELIDRCGSFASEINHTDSVSQAVDMKKFFITDTSQKKIPELLGPDYYERLMQIADSSKTGLKEMKPAIDVLNPAFLSFMVVGEMQLGDPELFQSTNFTMDLYFENYAASKGYESKGLESMQEQIDYYFVSSSLEEEAEDLKWSIDDYFSGNSETSGGMLENYINQDINQDINNIIAAEEFTNPVMIKRNKKMADGIDEIMKEKPVFVIIGAAHLPHEHGVLNLLHQKGYKVRPYSIKISKK